MTKRGSIAAVLFVLIVGIVGAVFLYGGGSSETGAMLLEQDSKPSKSPEPKVTLCHGTGSEKNPYVTISVANSAVAAHLAHGDTLGECKRECVCRYACQCNTEDEDGEPTTIFFGGTKGATSEPKCCPDGQICSDSCENAPDPSDLEFEGAADTCIESITCDPVFKFGTCIGKKC